MIEGDWRSPYDTSITAPKPYPAKPKPIRLIQPLGSISPFVAYTLCYDICVEEVVKPFRMASPV